MVTAFRSSWIEQLGDLARYRMAVAGLASRVSAVDARTQSKSSATQIEADNATVGERKEKEVRMFDAASIGDAALGDWEVEEADSWREMAKDWYSQGVSETPGSGKLQHHLALLSKGDELRGLYHYSKRYSIVLPLNFGALTDDNLFCVVSAQAILIQVPENQFYLCSKMNCKLDELKPTSVWPSCSSIFMVCSLLASRWTISMYVSADSWND